MLTIRLQRRGRKNDPSFRVILVESKRAAKTGNVNEILGNYDARTSRISLQGERIKYWISQGVTISDTVHNLLISNKIIEGKKINVLPRKSPPKKEGEEAAPEAAAAPAAEAATPAEVVTEEKVEESASAPESSGEAKGDNEVAA
jgi:small subunit ribosomal protein S16